MSKTITKPKSTAKVNLYYHPCRECKKPATKSLQLQWVEYDYNPAKDVCSAAHIIGDPCDSVHLCADCYEGLENGKLSL